tara:strand:+ start:1573 stop:2676 length:1104 start_codon:yes stop_codon:yes gene_type:complete
MIFQKRINFIKRISLFLFVFSFLALVLSLWLQNAIANFDYSKDLSDEKIKTSKFFSEKINCSEKIQECKKRFLGVLNRPKALGNCYIYNYKKRLLVNNQIISERAYLFKGNDSNSKSFQYESLKPELVNKDIEIQIIGSNKNAQCIKNSESYNLYKIFPFYYEFLYYLKNNPKTNLGALKTINPFIYGETSISNIVKRFPINYVFKSFLYISVILMYLYWISYRQLFIEILNSKNNKFVFFGLASAFFLFFHVLLLGIEFDNKIFKLIRKLNIALFILSEIMAQFFLSIRLYKNKNNLIKFCNIYIINIKLYFVIIISLISFFVVSILLIYDLSSKVDYILEWNYFAGLLFYYLLSYMMWKKQVNTN